VPISTLGEGLHSIVIQNPALQSEIYDFNVGKQMSCYRYSDGVYLYRIGSGAEKILSTEYHYLK